MSPRLTCRLLALVTLTFVLGTEAQAQRAPRRARPKPFAAFSESAERLKDSVAVRFGSHPVLDSPAPEAPFAAAVGLAAPDSVVAAARSQLGTRYVWGAERPGQAFDCSGLVRFVMSALRIDLPRTAHEQATQGTKVARDVTKLRPGDLLTFGKGSKVQHIGVYVGQGRFIHASTSQRRVVEASIDEPGTWFRRNWVGVRRLLAANETSDSVSEQ